MLLLGGKSTKFNSMQFYEPAVIFGSRYISCTFIYVVLFPWILIHFFSCIESDKIHTPEHVKVRRNL